MKSSLEEKIVRRLEFNTEYSADTDLIDDFLDAAFSEINRWRKNTDNTELLSGVYDNNIVDFVIESYNAMGIEGQVYDSNGTSARQYSGSPLSRLKTSIKQRL